jgi:hypothetical protein
MSRTFERDERTYTYKHEYSDEDSEGNYLNEYADPNDSDGCDEESKGPTIQHLYEGKRVKNQTTQTQPYTKKTRREREADSPRYAHTFATEDTEGATQTDTEYLHPEARTETPLITTPLPEEPEIDYRTTHHERSNTLDSLIDQFDQILAIRSTEQSEEEEYNDAEEAISELDINVAEPKDVEFEDNMSNTKKQKMPDPEPYYGKREKLSTWLMQLNIKLEGDNDYFKDDNAKILYACALLRGPASEWAEPYANNVGTQQTPKFESTTDFKTKIKAALGDPDPAGTAEEEIRNLKQGRDECSTYFTKFSQHVHKLSWDNAAKIAQFRYGLDSRISEKLIGRDSIPTTFPEYAQMCIKLDNEIRAYHRSRNPNHHQRFTPNRYTSRQPYSTNVPNWVVQGTRPGFQRPQQQPQRHTYVRPEDRRTSNANWHGPARMELDAVKRSNKCFKCGKDGHYARNCKGSTPQRGQPNKNRWQPQRNGPSQQVKTARRSDSEESEEVTTEVKQEEIDWTRENPLKEGCHHLKFIRSSDGALYQKFLNQDRYEKTRKIRAVAQTHQRATHYVKATFRSAHTHPVRDTRNEIRSECTQNWCKKLGNRRHLGISTMTFGKKCDRACQPFDCTKCGKTREQEQDSEGMISDQSLSKQECSTCRHTEMIQDDEEQRIQAALRTGRIPRGTRRFLDEIEEKLETITDSGIHTRIRATIAQLRINQIEEEMDSWNSTEEEQNNIFGLTLATEFTVRGTRPMEAQECQVCWETGKQQEYISDDGRIVACEECARTWTKTTGFTEWLKLESKN